jgi:hypothetical protein
MRYSIREMVLLAGACMMAGSAAWGQAAPAAMRPTSNSDIALTYNAAQANIVPGNNFSLQGGSLQIHALFWHSLGIVADVAGLHSANMHGTGVGLDLVSATFGARYTFSPSRRGYAVFGQVLGGEAFGMNSVFPTPTAVNQDASSLALQIGGGINLLTRHRVAVRAFETNWLRTQMPNATTNVQNNLRIGAGLIFRF